MTQQQETHWQFTVALNLYCDGSGTVPAHCVEVFENAQDAARSARDSQGRICLVLDPKDREAVQAQLDIDPAFTEIRLLSKPQRLPEVGDILQAAAAGKAGESYLCYINADINLPYWFFDFVAMNLQAMPEAGGLVINRKDLLDEGAAFPNGSKHQEFYVHPGYDCMVFPVSMMEKARFGPVTIGLPPIGSVVVTNMLTFLPKVKLLHEVFVTWHRGDGRASDWITPDKQAQVDQNFIASFLALDEIGAQQPIAQGGGGQQILIQKYMQYRAARSGRVA